MNFNELISSIEKYPGVTDDSREVGPGWIYVAGAGRNLWKNYLEDAKSKGAQIIVGEPKLLGPLGIKYVAVDDRLKSSAQLASAFYKNPSARALTIGVTGTCGKTTSTFLIESILQASGMKVGLIGTENIRYPGYCSKSPNTTPSTFVLNSMMSRMLEAGCDAIVMEVSSHGIAHQRTLGILFDGAVFTNLSVEHLDLHGSMEEYFKTKVRLFTDYAKASINAGKKFRAAVNVGNEWGAKLYGELRQHQGQSSYMLDSFKIHPDNISNGVNLTDQGIHGKINGVTVESRLVGRFNAENISGAISITQMLGILDDKISLGIKNMNPVAGRMEIAYSNNGRTIIVDYAHKPGALKVALETLREICKGSVICLFGCGGDRDKEKRPLMGKIAYELADFVIISSDNPRSESPEEIIDDILKGIPEGVHGKVRVEVDRRKGIEAALNISKEGDIVFIAGRGAEKEQIILDKAAGAKLNVPFDDREVARSIAHSLFK